MRSDDQPLVWGNGPRDRGCAYHTKSNFASGGDTIQIDVFVMPSIAAYRPIAITIGRYRHYKAIEKRKLSIRSTDECATVLPDVTKALVEVGCPAATSAYRAAEVRSHIKADAELVKHALKHSPEPT